MIVKKMIALSLLLVVLSACAQAKEKGGASVPTMPLTNLLKDISTNLNKEIIAVPEVEEVREVVVIGKQTRDLDYSDLLAILRLHGFTAFESDGLIKIVQLNTIRTQPLPTVATGQNFPPDQYVNKVIKLDKVCVVRVLPMLRPLVAQFSHMSAFIDSNTLVMVDNFANIQRIERIVKELESNAREKQDCTMAPKPE